MTEDQIVQRGFTAARILADTEFVSFFEELKTDIKTSLFATESLELDRRERFYAEHKGIEDLLSRLETYAATAQDILARNAE